VVKPACPPAIVRSATEFGGGSTRTSEPNSRRASQTPPQMDLTILGAHGIGKSDRKMNQIRQ
jgi:hypothetical protein